MTVDLIHPAALGLTAAAGIGYLCAVRAQWRRLGAKDPGANAGWWWTSFGLQSAGLAASLVDEQARGFAYGALAAWAGVAAILFAGRFVAASSRALLALPLSAVALLVAVAGVASIGAPPPEGAGWISRVHAGFMAAHLAALVAAGAGGALHRIAAARLKAADPRAIRLPTLPVLERLVERGLVWGTALLTGGLAVGGAAIRVSHTFQLLHPTALLGLAELALLVAVLAIHRANRLSRRSLSLAALACLAVALIGTLSQVVVRHG